MAMKRTPVSLQPTNVDTLASPNPRQRKSRKLRFDSDAIRAANAVLTKVKNKEKEQKQKQEHYSTFERKRNPSNLLSKSYKIPLADPPPSPKVPRRTIVSKEFTTTPSSLSALRVIDMLPILNHLECEQPLSENVYEHLLQWSHEDSTRTKLFLLGILPMVLQFLQRNLHSSICALQGCTLLHHLNVAHEISDVICAHGGIKLMVQALKRHGRHMTELQDAICQFWADLAYRDMKTFHSTSSMLIQEYLLYKDENDDDSDDHGNGNGGGAVIQELFQIIDNPSTTEDVLAGATRVLHNLSCLSEIANHERQD